MSIGENTLLLKRQKSCSVCSGLDFRDSLCLNCNNSHTTQQATLPISIKQCRGAAVRPASSKTTPLQSSLSSSLTVASPPPIFTFVEEAEQQQQGQASFDSRLASEDVNDGNDNGQCNNSGNAQRQQQSQQQQQPSLPLNEQLFKEYRDVTASSTAGLSSAFEFSESDDDDDSEDSDDDDGDNDCFSEDESIQWCFEDYFAGLPGNDWCVRVPTVFFQDEFNIFELPDVFHCPLRLTDFQPDFRKKYTEDYGFDDLLELIISDEMDDYSVECLPDGMLDDAVLLYKLIHQRYILSKQGLHQMASKFQAADFGTCPRYLCHGQPLLPVGLSALPGVSGCKVYCLNCQDLYTPASKAHATADGVAFGPTFAHFLVRTVLFAGGGEEAVVQRAEQQWERFIPKIYGFRIARGDEGYSDIHAHPPRDYK